MTEPVQVSALIHLQAWLGPQNREEFTASEPHELHRTASHDQSSEYGAPKGKLLLNISLDQFTSTNTRCKCEIYANMFIKLNPNLYL